MKRLVAICPTFRRPKLIPNVLAMFKSQMSVYGWKYHLVIVDDGQTFESQSGRVGGYTWELLTLPRRCESLGDKFAATVEHAADRMQAGRGDAIALFEDDDVYLPQYLRAHARTLDAGNTISMPSRLLANDSVGPGKTHPVDATGRHHGAWAYTLGLYYDCGGYPHGQSEGFDYALHSAMLRSPLYRRGDPCEQSDGEAIYVYRWQTSGYPNGSGWGASIYEATERTHQQAPPPELVPQFDAETQLYYRSLIGLSVA